MVYNGQKWARFAANFTTIDQDGKVNFDIHDKAQNNRFITNVTFDPRPGQVVYINNGTIAFDQLKTTDVVNLYVPGRGYGFSAQPGVEAENLTLVSPQPRADLDPVSEIFSCQQLIWQPPFCRRPPASFRFSRLLACSRYSVDWAEPASRSLSAVLRAPGPKRPGVCFATQTSRIPRLVFFCPEYSCHEELAGSAVLSATNLPRATCLEKRGDGCLWLRSPGAAR